MSCCQAAWAWPHWGWPAVSPRANRWRPSRRITGAPVTTGIQGGATTGTAGTVTTTTTATSTTTTTTATIGVTTGLVVGVRHRRASPS
jgi:hypothetical protein